MFLQHHGIKGQKWGKRNGPPYPLVKTRVSRTTENAESIYKTLSNKEKQFVMGDDNPAKKFYSENDKPFRVKEFVTSYKDTPVSVFNIWRENDHDVALALMTRSGDRYRNKGYANKTVQRGVQWLKNSGYEKAYWDVKNENHGSIALAKKNGFVFNSKDDGWSQYVLDLKKR